MLCDVGKDMTENDRPISPEEIFKKVSWRSVISSSNAMEKWVTWTLTGTAAIIALFVANLSSVSEIVSQSGIQWSLFLLALSLISGGVAKQVGMAVQSGLHTMREIEALLGSEEGQDLMDGMEIEPEKLIDDLAEPFWWPLSVSIKNAGKRGLKDYLAGDKRIVKLFCIQLYATNTHAILIAAAIIVVAFSLHAV